MKFLCLAIFISMNAFSAVYDCDLTDGSADWQRVTVKTDLKKNVSSVSLSTGRVGSKVIKLGCKKIESQTYSCSKNVQSKKVVVEIDFEESRLALTKLGSKDTGLYTCQ